MWWALIEEIALHAEEMACEKETACCVRGYHVYKYIWASAIGEVLVCSREPTNVVFVVKLYSRKIFFYVFCARKYFYNEKKSELRYALTPYTVEPLLTDTADTYDITDNSEVPTVLPLTSSNP